jgi:hypothetical protein
MSLEANEVIVRRTFEEIFSHLYSHRCILSALVKGR